MSEERIRKNLEVLAALANYDNKLKLTKSYLTNIVALEVLEKRSLLLTYIKN